MSVANMFCGVYRWSRVQVVEVNLDGQLNKSSDERRRVTIAEPKK